MFQHQARSILQRPDRTARDQAVYLSELFMRVVGEVSEPDGRQVPIRFARRAEGCMNIDEKMQTARSIVAEAESRVGQALALVRGLLGEIEEELRTLRVEKARREVQYFTRKQFAERLQVSEDTLKRAEDHGDIKPAVTIGSRARYSSLQLEWADEIFSKKRDATGRPKLGREQGAKSKGEVRFQIHNSRDEKAA